MELIWLTPVLALIGIVSGFLCGKYHERVLWNDQIIKEKRGNEPDDHEMVCSKCGDINEIQHCSTNSKGYCCPICHAAMKQIL